MRTIPNPNPDECNQGMVICAMDEAVPGEVGSAPSPEDLAAPTGEPGPDDEAEKTEGGEEEAASTDAESE